MEMEHSLAEQRRLDDLADLLEAENVTAAKAKAPAYLAQREFWSDLFAVEPPEFLDAPLADCMANLNAACEGDQIARDRICMALHQIERCALPLAEVALKDIYDAEGL